MAFSTIPDPVDALNDVLGIEDPFVRWAVGIALDQIPGVNTVVGYASQVVEAFNLAIGIIEWIVDGQPSADVYEGTSEDDVLVPDFDIDVYSLFTPVGLFTTFLGYPYIIPAGAGNDVLKASEKFNWDDLLIGGTGADTMYGYGGDDTYHVDYSLDVVIDNGTDGNDDTVISTAASYTLPDHIEHIVLDSGFEAVGNGLNNSVTGHNGHNLLRGMGGNDVVNGRAGDDTLDGGSGNDTLYGGAGNDRYVVDSTGDVIKENPNEGIDTAQASFDYTLDTIILNDGTRTAALDNLVLTGGAINGTGNLLANGITGNGQNNVLSGLDGNDSIDGGAGGDSLYGGNGNDTLTGGEGDGATDILAGGAGDDVYFVGTGDFVGDNVGTNVAFASSNYSVLGSGLSVITLTGTANIDARSNAGAHRLEGNSGANRLTAVWTEGTSTAADTLIGGEGNDTLTGTGRDRLEGGTGDDTYVVTAMGDSFLENVGEGTDLVYTSTANVTLAATDIENLQIDSAAALNGTGNSLANRIYVTSGRTGLGNMLSGLGGNDTLDGGFGADTLVGGQGDDVYTVDNTADVVVEVSGEGADVVNASATYTLSAHVETLNLTGTAAINGTGSDQSNQINGNDAGNVLDGGVGADTMRGGKGNDRYVVDNVADVVYEVPDFTSGAGLTLISEGNDTIDASVTYALSNSVEVMRLVGTADIDATGNNKDNILTGNDGSNVLRGEGGADSLSGGRGNDTLFSGNDLAVDTLDGGTGNDTFHVVMTTKFVTWSPFDPVGDFFDGERQMYSVGSSTMYTETDIVVDGGGISDTVVLYGGNLALYLLGSGIENLAVGDNNVTRARGNSLANRMVGGAGSDDFYGLAGDDTMDTGNGGGDFLSGGSGNDTYIIRSSGATILESNTFGDFEGTADRVIAFTTHTLSANIENMVLNGGAAITGTGNDQANLITVDASSTANHALLGAGGNDTLIGNAGDNRLDGGTGADTMTGGRGNDTYRVDNAGDVIVETASGGTDTVEVASGVAYSLGATLEHGTTVGNSATIYGNDGNNILKIELGFGTGIGNSLFGNDGNDSLVGAGYADVLDGGTGADTMVGNFGLDTFVVDNVGDVVIGGGTLRTAFGTSGTNTFSATSNTVTLTSNWTQVQLTGIRALNAVVDAGNTQFVTITGNDVSNTLTGGSGGASLIGGGGNDSLVGGAATDDLQGGTGNDTLDGGLGLDVMEGGLGNDLYYISEASEAVFENAGEGNDTIIASVDWALNAFDNVENLQLAGNALNATGNALNNRISGNQWSNILNGGLGRNVLMGGRGDDTYIVDARFDTIDEVIDPQNIGVIDLVNGAGGWDTAQVSGVGNNGTYSLAAGVEVLELVDAGINLTIFGNAVGNALGGSAGADTIRGGAGADTMSGGNGNDTYFVDNSNDVVDELFSTGYDKVFANASYSLDNANGDRVEELILQQDAVNGTGGFANNRIEGNGRDNILDGRLGADTLIGAGGADTFVVDNVGDVVFEGLDAAIDTVQSSVNSWALGSSGVENLTFTTSGVVGRFSSGNSGTGNSLNNVITGNIGKDTLQGLGGNDTLVGGAGDDTYTVEDAGDVVVEALNEGVDRVNAGIDYTLGANIEVLTLTGNGNLNGTGNATANTLNGTSGANVLDGGAGADTMAGGAGSDIYIVDDAADRIVEAAGGADVDTARASANYTLGTGVENLELTGTGNTRGTGNAGANSITGNDGNNLLDGGAGADYVFGGGGRDSIVFEASDTLSGGAGVDVLLVRVAAADLTALAPGQLTGFEEVNLVGSGNNTVTLDKATVLALSDTTDTVLVKGEAGDAVVASGGWTLGGTVTVSGLNYQEYISGTAKLVVDLNMDRSGIQLASDAATLNLSSLNGTNGFRLLGGAAGDLAGVSVSTAGDVNGDGYDDLIVGASGKGAGFGAAYVVFGKASGFGPSRTLDSMSAGEGFRIDGIAAGNLGGAVGGGGDINGDGFDDIIIGAANYDRPTSMDYSRGVPEIITSTPDTITLYGTEFGLSSSGWDTIADTYRFRSVTDWSSTTVSTPLLESRDVNGDGFNDLVINSQTPHYGQYASTFIYGSATKSIALAGDLNADGNEDFTVTALPYSPPPNGGAFVVYGANGISGVDLSALDGYDGFRIKNEPYWNGNQRMGAAVAVVGDMDGDGFADFVVGHDDPVLSEAMLGSVSSYSGGDPVFSVNNMSHSQEYGDYYATSGGSRFGFSVANAGDFNGDGFGDAIVGAPDYYGSKGAAFVMFGSDYNDGFSYDADEIDGTHLVRIDGVDGDHAGISVSGAGDFNADGVGDVIIGTTAGKAYVLYGKSSGFDPSIDLSTLDGSNGFVIQGGSGTVFKVAGVGDTNADGYDDILIGDQNADVNGTDSGAAYLVFGNASGAANLSLSSLDGSNGIVITGAAAGALAGGAVTAAGDINDDGYADFAIGSPGVATNGANAGAAYVVLGKDFNGAGGAVGTSGNDTLVGEAGAVMFGRGGDDRLELTANTPVKVDGGAGIDTVALDGVGASFNLSASNAFKGIERIDLGGASANTLTLNAGDVLRMSDTSNILTVMGSSSDSVSVTGTWLDGGMVTQGGQTYRQYLSGDALLQVDSDIGGTVTVNGVALSTQSGNRGFAITGSASGGVYDSVNRIVGGAGDFNGDGFGDYVVTGSHYDYATSSSVARRLVVFGSAAIPAGNMPLSSLDASNSISIQGSFYEMRSAGDVNGDGYDDLFMGNPSFSVTPGHPGETPYSWVPASYEGDAYVVFGSSAPASSVDITALNGSNGFRILGEAGDSLFINGTGDFNGDGRADYVVRRRRPEGDAEIDVIYGKVGGFGATLNMSTLALDGSDGFRVIHPTDTTQVITSFSPLTLEDRPNFTPEDVSVGDIDNDGKDDLIIGHRHHRPGGSGPSRGATYVVYGTAGSGNTIGGTAGTVDLADFDTLNNSNLGMRIVGPNGGNHRFGERVEYLGDFNGDGFGDFAVGASYDSANGYASGAVYVVYGRARSPFTNFTLGGDTMTGVFALDDMAYFTKISGANAGDTTGFGMSAAGDVNGDGVDDLLIGARHADGHRGRAYVIYGQNNPAPYLITDINLATLSSSRGQLLAGDASTYNLGINLSAAGDLNGDGLDDFMVGQQGGANGGAAFVVYGSNAQMDSTLANVRTGNSASDFDSHSGTFNGTSGNDTMVGFNTIFNGGAGDDLFKSTGLGVIAMWGGAGNDTFYVFQGGNSNNNALNFVDETSINYIRPGEITGVEEFYFQSGIQSIKLDAVDVARISDTDTLRLSGLGTVTLDDSFGTWNTAAGTGLQAGYTVATAGASTVLVQDGMTLAFS